MRILVIGGGGREHALAWKLAQSSLCSQVIAAPGNPGIAEIGVCVSPPAPGPEGYLQIAEEHDAGLTVVGPEAALVDGVVDLFRSKGRQIVGPTAKGARLEGSKLFAKQFMVEAGVPTARYAEAGSRAEALEELKKVGFPGVIKYDGLYGGKGVVLVDDSGCAESAIAGLPEGKYVVEERLFGEEVSYIVYSDGEHFYPFETTQDHKPVLDGDKGPNTGGMGAYCDTRILDDAGRREIEDRVIQPTLDLMKRRGDPFTGFLYAGLMMTDDGPKVLEFNVRLGDPECQPLMHRLSSDLVATLTEGAPMEWNEAPSVCVVMAAEGYPASPRKGDPIKGLKDCPATVFHAGTKQTQDGIVTNGGRVLGVVDSGLDLAAAIKRTYAAVKTIEWEGVHYRTDIGQKGLKRW